MKAVTERETNAIEKVIPGKIIKKHADQPIIETDL